MTSQSTCSSSSSWLGAFARSLSGSLSSIARPILSDHGVELAPIIDSCTALDCSGSQRGGAVSRPINIGGCDKAAVAGPASVEAPASSPAQSHTEQDTFSVPQAARPGQAAAGIFQQPQQQQQQSVSRSSSSGLPSALTAPAPANTADTFVPAPSALSIPPILETARVQQPQQQQQARVRWVLPDDDGDCTGTSAEPQQKYVLQAAIARGQGQGSSASHHSVAPGSSTPRTLGSSAISNRSPRSSRLPASGSEQLDKYLRYLLRESHPHKFMYYPNWGLTDNGCAAIGEFLRRDNVIKVMTLSGNDIRDDGVELIAEALAGNSCLVTLDLSGNKISNVGAIALAEALHSNKRLAELQLNSNRIGDEGAEALAAAAAASTTLKKLHLQGNLISSAQLQVVQHVLKTRQYKMPNKQPSASNLRAHLRKNSSLLQFHIELSDSDDVIKSVAKHRLQLPPATAIVALSAPMDPLEESLCTQVTHLIAELEDKDTTGTTEVQGDRVDDVGVLPAAAAATTLTPALDGHPRGTEGDVADQVYLLAVRLACRGYEVVLRTSCPAVEASEQQSTSPVAGSKESSMMGLKHTFVRVVQPGLEDESTPPIIVDPLFRENFEIAHATDRYKTVLDALPRVLCLAESRLYHLVEAITHELKIAFKESGLSCPPWREANTVLDKWLARIPQDVRVDPDADVQQLKQLVAMAGNR